MPLVSRSAFALLVLGFLAPGVLPAQDPYLVRDINQTIDKKGLVSREVLPATGGPYYSFDDGIHGAELWRGEGSGSSLVIDLCPGSCESSPRDFAELGGKVYFFADDGVTGQELWRTDGTPGGTVLVRDLCPGTCSSWPAIGSSPVVIGDALFFRARDSRGHMGLWTSDGTREGIRLAADICPGCDAGIYDLTAVGDTLFFRADDGEHGIELWSSDGTETALVRDDCSGECSSGLARDLPDLFTPYGDDLFYWQLTGDRWRLRAIVDDPFILGHTIELPYPDLPRLAIVGSALLLSVSNWLGRIDVPSFTGSLFRLFYAPVGPLTALKGFALFRGPGNTFELWRTDGTDAGTQLVTDTNLYVGLPENENMVVLEDRLFFTASQGNQLWRSDGTAAGTLRLDDPSSSPPLSSMAGLVPDPGRRRLLFTSGNPASREAELWEVPVDALRPSPVRRLVEIPGSADLRSLTAFGETALLFSARGRLWRSDGTESGTKDLYSAAGTLEEATPFQGRVVFRNGTDLWMTDGSRTRRILLGLAAEHLTVAGDRIFISGQSSSGPDRLTGFELWSSDGTPAGTRLIKDIVPGNGSSSPRQLTPAGSRVFFVVSTLANGAEVWSSDGTPDGTQLHADLCPGRCSSDPQLLAVFAGRLVAAAGGKIWISNPASSGALPLLSIGRSTPDPVVFQGRLFFFAEDTAGREHLWSSDGTAPGTVRLQEVSGPDQPRTAHEPTVVDDRLYFTSWTEGTGQELWVSDGTAGGTSLLADIGPGPLGSAPRHLTAVGEHLFFSADDGNAGRELWRMDGTAAGTHLVADIDPGPGSAAPDDLTFTGKHLFFSADDGTNGRELWALEIEEPEEPEEPYTPCAPGADRLCLHGGRFEVSVGFRDPLAGGAAKTATAIPDSDESGFFWFFTPGNLELVVKLLDGRSANGQFWVFFGALSDVEYTVTVTDRATGAVKTYRNPRGTFCGQADTAAFPDPGEAIAPARSVLSAPALADAEVTGSCIPGPTALCLGGGRFRAEARWKDHSGLEGTATAVPRTGESGTFWFFSPGNTELVVKVLDGTGFNGKHWVFYGALSDVEYWLTVTDTMTGAAKTWHNPPGTYCGQGDTSAL